MQLKNYIPVIPFLLLFFACKVDPKISTPFKPVEIVPEGWPQPVYSFSTNTLSESKFQLGRSLFYETMLSRDNTISCATCHQSNFAFANIGHKVSHGINDLVGKRNAPAMFNLNWHPYFMHDGGINHIEVQPLGPIANPIEMDENIGNVLEKLKGTNKYRVMFKNAYGTEEISSQRFLWAMAQFMGLLYSNNSKYDRYKKGEKNSAFTEEELRGYNLFKTNCNACHAEPLFTDFKFRNNGLAVNPAYKDSGRMHITRQPEDLYKFKTPSLRNIEVTGEYMHDGRYETLEDCLNHYTDKINNNVNLDPLLQNPLPLSADNKKDIIAFLKTLTDTAFINNKRFNDPKTNP
ncbi:MAG: cytochrome-c peroxidase [Bacteroidia bacterium]|nr:cytochrome-c peroxidase [Bacteroidia bacterium]